MSEQITQPAKNERVSRILEMLSEGKPRDKIADQFGYSTWKSLDIYMRRHGFSWDSQRQIYTQAVVEEPAKEEFKSPNVDVHPEDIVRLFNTGILGAREIAKKVGFLGHKEMATYMLRHGYVWSSTSLNYKNTNHSNSRYVLIAGRRIFLMKKSMLVPILY